MRMPRSQIPAGTVHLAKAVSGLLPSVGYIRRLSASRRTPILMPATIHISGFNSAACALAFPLLRTPPLRDRTSGWLPAWWLPFGRAGLACRWQTHPLGDNNEFQGTSSLSHRPELRSARAAICYTMFSDSGPLATEHYAKRQPPKPFFLQHGRKNGTAAR